MVGSEPFPHSHFLWQLTCRLRLFIAINTGGGSTHRSVKQGLSSTLKPTNTKRTTGIDADLTNIFFNVPVWLKVSRGSVFAVGAVS